MLQLLLEKVKELSELTGWEYTLEYGYAHNHSHEYCWNLQVYANQYLNLPSFHIGGTIQEAHVSVDSMLHRIKYEKGLIPHE